MAAGPSNSLDNARRAEMTVGCRDCDLISKVRDAGKVISFEGRPVQIMHNSVRVVAGGYFGDWMTALSSGCRDITSPNKNRSSIRFSSILRA
jgi:hypothetical protein